MFDTNIDTEEIAKALIALAHNNIDTIRKIKDSEGRVHLLQTSLIKRVEEDSDDKTMNIHLLNGDYFFIKISAEELVNQLNIPSLE